MEGEDKSHSINNGAVKPEPDSEKPDQEEWLDILGSQQILKKVVKPGENDTRPKRSDVCCINLEGKLEDGTVIEKYENYSINVGDGEVIQGVDLTLTLMDVGEAALVKIGPRFAFGSRGRASENSFPSVPPDANLVYSIELLSVSEEPDLETVSLSERKAIGNRKRERGNWWYARDENTLAIQIYRRALDYLDEACGGIQIEPDNAIDDEACNKEERDQALFEILEDRVKVYNNLAAAQLKIGSVDAASLSIDHVLKLQPKNVKALFRKAKILAEKREHRSAISVLEELVELDPKNSAVRSELQVQKAKAKQLAVQEKSLYQKMMSGTSANARSTQKTSEKSKFASILPWGVVFGSMAAVVVAMAAYRFKFM